MIYTETERTYLTGQGLGRLATVAADGSPQVRPLGFRVNPDDTIDVGGPNLTATQRYRNVRANPVVSFVVDDMTPDDPREFRPGWGRGVEIRGRTEIVEVEMPPVNPEWFSHTVIRIHPSRVLSWNLEEAGLGGNFRDIAPQTGGDQH